MTALTPLMLTDHALSAEKTMLPIFNSKSKVYDEPGREGIHNAREKPKEREKKKK